MCWHFTLLHWICNHFCSNGHYHSMNHLSMSIWDLTIFWCLQFLCLGTCISCCRNLSLSLIELQKDLLFCLCLLQRDLFLFIFVSCKFPEVFPSTVGVLLGNFEVSYILSANSNSLTSSFLNLCPLTLIVIFVWLGIQVLYWIDV